MEGEHLNIDDALRRSAGEHNSYPDIQQVQDIWLSIDARRRHRGIVRLQRLAGMAASLLLLSMAVIWYYPKEAKTGLVVDKTQTAFPGSEKEDEAIRYIQNVCQGGSIVCSSPEFKELQSAYNHALINLTGINKEINVYGNDEQLVRAKTRIENHLAGLLKAMVQLL